MKKLLVVGADWKFRALLRAELRERGYDARGYESLAEAEAELASGEPPAALLLALPAGESNQQQEQIARWALYLPVILVVAGSEKKLPEAANIRVLRHPVRVEDVVATVVEQAGPAH